MIQRTFVDVNAAERFANVLGWKISGHQHDKLLAERRIDEFGSVRELHAREDGYGIFYYWVRL